MHLWQRCTEYRVKALQTIAVEEVSLIVDPPFDVSILGWKLFTVGVGQSVGARSRLRGIFVQRRRIEASQHLDRIPLRVALNALSDLLNRILGRNPSRRISPDEHSVQIRQMRCGALFVAGRSCVMVSTEREGFDELLTRFAWNEVV